MINTTYRNYYTSSNMGFKSRPLANVELKKPDGTLVKAYFSELNPQKLEDRQTLAIIKKRWKEYNNILCGILLAGEAGKIYAIETAGEKPLEDRLLTLTNISVGGGLYLEVEHLLSSPDSRFSKENSNPNRIEGGGTVMMAMLTKLTSQMGLNAILLNSYEVESESASPFYEKLNMTRLREREIAGCFYSFKGKDKDKFIRKIESEYKLGEINSKYIEEVKDSLL